MVVQEWGWSVCIREPARPAVPVNESGHRIALHVAARPASFLRGTICRPLTSAGLPLRDSCFTRDIAAAAGRVGYLGGELLGDFMKASGFVFVIRHVVTPV
jgi:hypothetical protein